VLFRILPKHVVGKILHYACGSQWEGGISPRTFLALLTLRPTLDRHFNHQDNPRYCSLDDIRIPVETEEPMQTAATATMHTFELRLRSHCRANERRIVTQMFDCADFASREPSAESSSLAAVRKMCHVVVEHHQLLPTTTSDSIADMLVRAIWSALETEMSRPAESSLSALSSSSASASGPIGSLSTCIRLGWCCFLSQSVNTGGGEGGHNVKHDTLLFCDRKGSTIWTWHLWGDMLYG
jgi:hypothetical protein